MEPCENCLASNLECKRKAASDCTECQLRQIVCIYNKTIKAEIQAWGRTNRQIDLLEVQLAQLTRKKSPVAKFNHERLNVENTFASFQPPLPQLSDAAPKHDAQVLNYFIESYLPILWPLSHPEFISFITDAYYTSWLVFNAVSAAAIVLRDRAFACKENPRLGQEFYERGEMSLSSDESSKYAKIFGLILLARVSGSLGIITSFNYYIAVAYNLAKDYGFNSHLSCQKMSRFEQELAKRMWMSIVITESCAIIVSSNVSMVSERDHRISLPCYPINSYKSAADISFEIEAGLFCDPFFLIRDKSKESYRWTLIRYLMKKDMKREKHKEVPILYYFYKALTSLLENFKIDHPYNDKDVETLGIRFLAMGLIFVCLKDEIIAAINSSSVSKNRLFNSESFENFTSHFNQTLDVLQAYAQLCPNFDKTDSLFGPLMYIMARFCKMCRDQAQFLEFETQYGMLKHFLLILSTKHQLQEFMNDLI